MPSTPTYDGCWSLVGLRQGRRHRHHRPRWVGGHVHAMFLLVGLPLRRLAILPDVSLHVSTTGSPKKKSSKGLRESFMCSQPMAIDDTQPAPRSRRQYPFPCFTRQTNAHAHAHATSDGGWRRGVRGGAGVVSDPAGVRAPCFLHHSPGAALCSR